MATRTKKYVLGIDFGTESGRALLVDVATGREVATSVYEYKDGVIDRTLPGSKQRLEPDWALQNPRDYLRVLEKAVPAVLDESGVSADDVIGIGTDFTACTMMPTDRDGVPLCMKKEFANEPHAWVKLWKHHAAQPEADLVNKVGRERGETFLDRYGGKISSEWFFPKALQILKEAPHVYRAADRLIEGADWITWQLTGVETRNSCTAGYKAIWDGDFPSEAYFGALDKRFAKVVDEKMSRDISPAGTRAGGLTEAMAKRTGLRPGTPVAVGGVDAHVAVPACTVTTSGKMVMIMGTSVCHMLVDKKSRIIEGLCGVVRDGIIPNYYGYEGGQSAVGDIFAWYTRHGVPDYVHDDARTRKTDVHTVLEKKAAALRPGESGLLALDWWNGNRSVLVDADLTGMLMGYTLETRPEEIYRALIEATAFGTNTIIRAMEKGGVRVRELYACGGLPQRNRLLMQIFADVTNRELKVAASEQTVALGTAMWGAVAAGKKNGGYNTISEAAGKMAHVRRRTYTPDRDNHRIYTKLYAEYEQLHDLFGRGANDVMKRLKAVKLAIRQNK